jgi:hypothetical protein
MRQPLAHMLFRLYFVPVVVASDPAGAGRDVEDNSNADVERVLPYLKQNVTDALIEAVLITAVAHGERQIASQGNEVGLTTPTSSSRGRQSKTVTASSKGSPLPKQSYGWGPSGWYAWWYGTGMTFCLDLICV